MGPRHTGKTAHDTSRAVLKAASGLHRAPPASMRPEPKIHNAQLRLLDRSIKSVGAWNHGVSTVGNDRRFGRREGISRTGQTECFGTNRTGEQDNFQSLKCESRRDKKIRTVSRAADVRPEQQRARQEHDFFCSE